MILCRYFSTKDFICYIIFIQLIILLFTFFYFGIIRLFTICYYLNNKNAYFVNLVHIKQLFCKRFGSIFILFLRNSTESKVIESKSNIIDILTCMLPFTNTFPER